MNFKLFFKKTLETFYSIIPMIGVIVILYLLNLIPGWLVNADGKPIIELKDFLIFLICGVTLIIGSSEFQVGAETSLAQVGNHIGTNITKRSSIILMIIVAFLLGLLVTIAEPDLSVLGEQLKATINPWLVKISVGIGVGILFIIGICRIVFQWQIKYLFLFFYFFIFAIGSLFGPSAEKSAFISLSFDASGVTTGPATVPFVISFGAAIASTRGGKDSSKDAFGLTGMMSVGPILSMLVLTLFKNDTTLLPVAELEPIVQVLIQTTIDVAIGIAPIFFFFYIYNFIFIKLPFRELLRILLGFVHTYIGLYIFMCSAKIGFIPLGNALGINLASNPNIYYMFIILCVILGMIIVLAEPSVSILTEQVEEISGGTLKKKTMIGALSVGVASAITLEVCRIVFWNSFSPLYYLVPLYIIAILLTFFVPDIYVAVAFDSGGVASGALASCFILPFVIGISAEINEMKGSNINSGFGVIGMIACMPIVTIELLGVFAKFKVMFTQFVARKRVYDDYDAQIIHFGD